MRIVFALITAFALSLLTSPAAAQDSELTYKSTEVAPGIWMIEGVGGFGGGNIGLLVGEEKIVLIDDAMVPTAQQIVDEAHKVAGRAVDFVINTHAHGDHVGGNAILAGEGALIFAHHNLRETLEKDPKDAGGDAGLPVVTFSDEVTFHVNGMEVRVFHLAHAHTDGDAAIHFPDVNVIHAGDVMFNELFPFIDLDSGGSVEGFLAAQKELLDLADGETVIIPGHGALGTRADLQRDHEMLLDCRDRVKKLVDEGRSEEEILAANPLADYHDDYNWGFITTERMTKTLVASMTGGE
jgi:glyoxylase-like metal-dependent hydrolase (beta-lactamase superfamily II)